MGLDISVWRHLERLESEPTGNDHWPTCLHISDWCEFPGRTAPFSDGWYKGERAMQFRAGSYRRYGEWREQLAKLAGYPALTHEWDNEHPHSRGAWQADGGPFWELVNFADNEGVIGADVAAKLARDFSGFQARAEGLRDPDFFHLYRIWRRAFELASVSGAVEFH